MQRTNDWTQIEPLLDDAMAALDETDRSAVLLRYFENKSLREVGEALGASEDAAQKRISRAVERLREFFSKRNGTIGAGGLAVLVSANAVQAAPVGLAATISAAAVLAETAVSTSTAITATKVIAMTTIAKTQLSERNACRRCRSWNLRSAPSRAITHTNQVIDATGHAIEGRQRKPFKSSYRDW